MTAEEFKKLEKGNPVHTECHDYKFLEYYEDWVIVYYKDKVGERLVKEEYSLSYFLENFTVGRHPDNLPKEPEQLFVNVYKFSGNFETASQCYKSAEEAYKMHAENVNYQYTAKIVPVETKEPFIPKHGEKCKFEDFEGCICECEAVEIKGNFYAYYEAERGGSRIYYPYQIKQFLPL